MIDVLTPLVVIMLIFLVIATTALVGHASKEVVLKVTERLFGIGTKTIGDGSLERLFMYLAFGFAFIIIYGILLSVFTLLSQIGVLLIIGFSVIVELLRLARRRKGERILDIARISKEHLKSFLKEPGQVFLAALLFVAVLWYFCPAIGLASYPGGDDKAYAFVTKAIINRGTALTPINYPYAQPYTDHFLQAGFMVAASFFYDLLQLLGLPTSIPLIHLFLTLLCFSLIPMSVYLLTMGLSRNREFSSIVALATLFMWTAIPYYFYWGGIGEALGYFLVPVFVLLDYRLNVTLMRNNFGLRAFTGATVVKFVFAAVAMYVHMYSLFLFAFLVIVVTPLWALRNHLPSQARNIRDKTKVYLRIILPYMIFVFGAVILLIGAMVLMPLAGSENPAIRILFGYLISSPHDIMTSLSQVMFTAPSLIFRNGYGLVYSAYQLGFNMNYYLGYWGFGLVLLCLFFILYPRLSKNRGRVLDSEGMRALALAEAMVIAAAIFFIFSQDSPFGWYYIPYPMAITVYTSRLYYELSLIIIYAESFPLYLMYHYIKKELLNLRLKIRKGSKRGLAVSIRKYIKPKKAVALAIVIVVIASSTIPAISNNYRGYVINRGESVVTQNDLDAFSWIETNTLRNATFFANYYDGGGFVYLYTGRIVLPPDAIRANPVNSSAAAFYEAETMLQQGNITQELIQLLRGYNVSYVYVGARIQYDGPRFNTIALIQSPYFEIAFHEGGAYVFRIRVP